jgi:hypothetical protein
VRRVRQPGLAAKVPLPAQEGIDTAMSNQGQAPANSAHLRIHVYANIGDEDNLISVKQFATRTEAKAWMDQQKKERPGYYEILHESEFDCSA